MENISREELTEKLLKFSDIIDQLKELTDSFDNFAAKHVELKSELPTTRNSNSLL